MNPRTESLDNQLIVRNDQFLALRLNPIKLSESLLTEVYGVMARYTDRYNLDKVLTDSRWRNGIPLDRVGVGMSMRIRKVLEMGEPTT